MGLRNLVAYWLLPWSLLLLLGCSKAVPKTEEPQTYIIHMDHSHKPPAFSTHELWHRSTLQSLSNPVNDKEMFLYSYNHVMHGFSARLTRSQLAEIERSPAHVGTDHESFGKLFTTYSPKFLGLHPHSGIWPTASYGKGVIIGILDTGIWPESESFNDNGMPPVPQRWKGQCENGTTFSSSACNKKLIGARSFSKGLKAAGRNISSEYDYDSARDFLSHGTHTSATAAGNHVLGVSHFGYARGTARGIAPRAHVAMYKVLFATDTEESAATDVLAGMDQAISDGVDIMSLSLGFEQTPYFNDVIAIASLSALEKGIFVVCAAGNDGAYNSTYNGAPWITTVGAGTLDRSFAATMTRNDGLTFEGISYYPESIYINDAPFYYGIDGDKAICYYNSLNQTEVHRQIVICDNSTKTDVEGQMQELERVGAYAGIFMSDLPLLHPDDYTNPGLVIPIASGPIVKEYANEKTVPKANIKFMSTKFGNNPAPQVAYFSSRGPDPITPGVLKPDILAPGVDILAAVIPNKPYMQIGKKYDLVTDYALKSGTSMAAPHVAGVAALLKSIHPDWSPAATRSAIMTTAYTIDSNRTTLKDQWTGLSATPLDFGAGHINPNKAMDPGLIYDMGLQDYIDFLCGLNYTAKQMSAILRRSQWNCGQEPSDLNYPSFIAIFTKDYNLPMVMSFSRTVTNLGDDAAIYQAILEIPPGMRIAVEPSTLVFTQKFQKQSFSLSLEIDKDAPTVVYGFLKWIDQHNHIVSSPIVAVKF